MTKPGCTQETAGLFVLADKSRREKVTLNHPIFTRWPARYPDRFRLFSTPTPNGVIGFVKPLGSIA